MNCDTCKEKKQQLEPVSAWTHEADMARMSEIVRKLYVLLIITLVLLFGTNAAWIYYESTFIEESVTQEVDTGNGDAYVAGIGDVTYGESETDG